MNFKQGLFLFFATLTAFFTCIQGVTEAGLLVDESELNSLFQSGMGESIAEEVAQSDETAIFNGFYNPQESSGATSTGTSLSTSSSSASATVNTFPRLKSLERSEILTVNSTSLGPAPYLSAIFRPPIG